MGGERDSNQHHPQASADSLAMYILTTALRKYKNTVPVYMFI